MPTPIREKIATNAQPYLRPGEQVQGAFAGQSISGWWSLLTYLMFFWLRFRSVIVTDQRILILDTGKWSMTKPKGVVAELPRNVVIGPPSGLWWKCLTLGEKLYVHRRFHKDIVASDTLLAQSGMPVQQIPLGGHQREPQQQWQQAPPQQPQDQYGAPQPPGQPQQQWQPAPQQQAQPQQQWQQQPPQQPQQPQPPRFAEQDEDNRTRIRPATPRPDQPDA